MNANCCATSTNPCDSTIAERPRYYPRQLITPDDLTLEQNYFRDRMRRHNRLLHGWGVVCGGLVCPVTTTNADGTTSFTPWQVQVQQGYILGPYGDEIILDCARTVDLRTPGVSGVTGEPCIDAPDPWCSQVFTPPSTTNVLYIAVKYQQAMTRPVRVQPIGCGCDNTNCEYSRWHDGYEIGVLQTCPACNACDPNVKVPDLSKIGQGDVPGCPDCSCGPWVCLAQVTLSSDGSGTVQQIDNCSCRRIVVSLCNFWWKSADVLSSLQVTNAPVSVTAGGAAVTVTVTGNSLDLKAKYYFGPGPGITVQSPAWTPGTQPGTSVDLQVTASANASPANYTLTVVNPDCNAAIVPAALTVSAGSSFGRATPVSPPGQPKPGSAVGAPGGVSAAPATPLAPAKAVAAPETAGAPVAKAPQKAAVTPEAAPATPTPAPAKRGTKTPTPPAENPPGS